uniref:Phage protein n=1 Tax=Ditylenchus dipsaci TaxID=166011 RepID=A0A915CYX0_9BILA
MKMKLTAVAMPDLYAKAQDEVLVSQPMDQFWAIESIEKTEHDLMFGSATMSYNLPTCMDITSLHILQHTILAIDHPTIGRLLGEMNKAQKLSDTFKQFIQL